MFKKKGIEISNDNNKNKKVIVISIVSFVAVLSIIVLITTGGLSKLMGNSVTEYYCEDSSYKLEGDKCVKEIKEKAAFLGDVNQDDKITNDDLELVNRYINYVEFEEEDEEISKLKPIQIKAADVSEDGDVYYLDIDLLKAYLEQNTATYGAYQENIGTKRICADDFKLEGTECIKKDIVDAKVKITEVSDEDSKVGDNNSINNPVEVSFKPENESTDIEANKLYKINVKFDVKDKTKQYYYIWKTYKYGENDFSTECKAVNEGENSGNFIMDGTKKVNVSVYSDSECKNQVSTFDSKEYSCKGCADGIDISLIPENEEIVVDKNANYKMNVKFDIKNKKEKYYYIWSNYLNGENNYNTPCTEVKEGEHSGSFKVNGYRRAKVTVYSDSSCKNRIKDVESKMYAYEGINKINDESTFPIKPDILYKGMDYFAWVEPVKIRYRDIDTKKVIESTDKNDLYSVPYNTDIFLKLHFSIKDSSKQYFYKIGTNGDGFSTNQDKCYPVPKNLTDTTIVTFKLPYNRNYYPDKSAPEHYRSYLSTLYRPTVYLYTNSDCNGTLGTFINNKLIQPRYFEVKIDANGGSLSRISSSYDVTYNQENDGIKPWPKLGYDFIGYKVKNSNGLYKCYTNSSKNSISFTNESNCKKYGYYIYYIDTNISNLTSKHNDVITLIAQWSNNPVTISVGKYEYKAYKIGTKISNKVTFKLNDKHNKYYYKWIYLKARAKPSDLWYQKLSHFAKMYDPYYNLVPEDSVSYSYFHPLYEGKYGRWEDRFSPCKRITNNLTISPMIQVDRPINAGMVYVYSDSKCEKALESEITVHRITGVYKCTASEINSKICE